MEQNEFVNRIFAKLSNEGFVQSYRSQLRLAIHKFSSANRDFSFEPFQHTLKSELLCNIISEYMQRHGLKNSYNVFIEESGFHKMNEPDILRMSHISNVKSSILETLVGIKNKTGEYHTVETQTDNLSLAQKLSRVDEAIRANRSSVKSYERQKLVHDRLEQIKKEKEIELEKRLQYTFNAQTTMEMSRSRMDQTEKFRLEVENLKAQYETMFLKKSAEFKLAREQEEEATKMLQEELDKQIAKLKAGLDPAPSNISAQQAHEMSQKKLKKLLGKAQNLMRKRESLKIKLKAEQEAHKQTLRELAELQKKFASLSV